MVLLQDRNTILSQRRKRLERCLLSILESSIFVGRSRLWKEHGEQSNVCHVLEQRWQQ